MNIYFHFNHFFKFLLVNDFLLFFIINEECSLFQFLRLCYEMVVN